MKELKFLLDTGISLKVAEFLRHMNYDTVHLRDRNLQRLQDEQILYLAASENRVILTHDLDFGRLLALKEKKFPSAITFRLTNMVPDNVIKHLTNVITKYEIELINGAALTITDRSIRIRNLPIIPSWSEQK